MVVDVPASPTCHYRQPLKKRKLLIKDMIAALESELIPDLDA